MKLNLPPREAFSHLISVQMRITARRVALEEQAGQGELAWRLLVLSLRAVRRYCYVVPTRIAHRLGLLAEGCRVVQVTRTGAEDDGWSVDSWALEPSDIDRLLDAYRELLVPSCDDQVQALLHDTGIDLDALLADADGAREMITRADLCELAAAASLLAAGNWPAERLVMPNVPKGSRKKSESGIDILSSTLEPEQDGALAPGEMLLLASVKHTLTSATTLRTSLVASVLKELTPVYLATQLRVYKARLDLLEPRLNTDRVFLFLDGFPDDDHVRIVALAVVDPDMEQDLAAQLQKLPGVPEGVYSMRILYVPGLAGLHERAV